MASIRATTLQVERNLQDAMGVARNVCLDPRLVPGGGAVEMAVSHSLAERAQNIQVCFSGIALTSYIGLANIEGILFTQTQKRGGGPC